MKIIRRVLVIIFGLIGIAFLVAGLAMHVWYSDAAEGMVPVTGKIVELNRYNPAVEYEFDGKTYRVYANSSSSSDYVGKEYRLMVDPEHPELAEDPVLQLLSMIFAAIGLVMAGIAILCHVLMRRVEKKAEELLGFGTRVMGTVSQVYQNRNVRLNGRSPWIVEVECYHPQTQERIFARSHSVWHTSLQPGDSADVLFDPYNQKKYVVDVKEEKA